MEDRWQGFTDYLLEDTDYVEKVMGLEDMGRQSVLEVVEVLEGDSRMRDIIYDARREDITMQDIWEDPSSNESIKLLQSLGLAEFSGPEQELETTWASRLYIDHFEEYSSL